MHEHPEIIRHYEVYDEASRLTEQDPLEFVRSTEIIERYLPPPPAVIVDVGGGPGVYARWLVELGYRVYLFDVVPRHIETARRQADPGHLTAEVADARSLPVADTSADVVLLLGPLYHLVQRPERLAALQEARRVLKPGGSLIAAGISRYASAIDGAVSGYLRDPVLRQMVENALVDGQHRNPTADPKYFTTAYFHRPDELSREVVEAGFEDVELLAVEGFGWAVPDVGSLLDDADARGPVLELLRRLETEPSLLGASPHLLASGRAP